MNEDQRNKHNRFEELAALHAVKIMQSEGQAGLSAEEAQLLELGQLLRNSVSTDLPRSNPDLRSQILKQLESDQTEFQTESVVSTVASGTLDPVSRKPVQSASDSVSREGARSLSRLLLTLATGVVLAVLGWWIYSAESPASLSPLELADGTYSKYQFASLSVAPSVESPPVQPESSQPTAIKSPRYEVRTRQVPVTTMQTQTKTRTVPVTRTRLETKTRKIPVTKLVKVKGEDGKMIEKSVTEIVEQSYQVSVPYTENATQQYTVQVPVTKMAEEKYLVEIDGHGNAVAVDASKHRSSSRETLAGVGLIGGGLPESYTFDSSRSTDRSSNEVLESLLKRANEEFGANYGKLIQKASKVTEYSGANVREIGKRIEEAKMELVSLDAKKQRATSALNSGRIDEHLFKLKQRGEIRDGGSRDLDREDATMELRISELKIQLKSLLTRLGPGHRDVETLQEAIAQWESFHDSQNARVDGESVELKLKPKQVLRLYLQSLEDRIDDARSAIKVNVPRYQSALLEAQRIAAIEKQSGESYAPVHENDFRITTGVSAVSTFSVDVDTASYANMRRLINSNRLPPPDSVRLEELINYFDYDYPQPEGDDPFSVNMELASCPWSTNRKLLRVGIQGKQISTDERPSSNIVFLIDVSGSMNSQDKLPLLKRGFQMMVDRLNENDRVSIVTYAGKAGVALKPTSGDQKRTINEAIEKLQSGGSTHGSAGIKLAYELAQKNFIHDGVNKVILATDGDLNVGVTQNDELVELNKKQAAENVFLTVLGFGSGNIKDDKMEALADNGNGIYAYIDGIPEAKKVLVKEMSGSLVTIAKDVKIQIEFNPVEVISYRLLGYENRILATEDFNNDQKDAGEIGAGHSVTAIYELVTSDKPDGLTSSDATTLKYQQAEQKIVEATPEVKASFSAAAQTGELLTLALRYKQPDESFSKRIEFTIDNDQQSFGAASDDFRFAASVASFGMLLRGSRYQGQTGAASILDWASGAIGDDASGYRTEFLELVRKFETIVGR